MNGCLPCAKLSTWTGECRTNILMRRKEVTGGVVQLKRKGVLPITIASTSPRFGHIFLIIFTTASYAPALTFSPPALF